MPFSDSIRGQGFARSGGRCECTRIHMGVTNAPHHGERCPTTLAGVEGWEAHHITAVGAGGQDILSNCEILCVTCHQLTQSYGRPG